MFCQTLQTVRGRIQKDITDNDKIAIVCDVYCRMNRADLLEMRATSRQRKQSSSSLTHFDSESMTRVQR